MARKFLDKDGLTALWAKIVDKINSLGDSLASVAFSGSYNDLTNKPTIPDISGKVDKTGDPLIVKDSNMPSGAANLSASATAHRVTMYRNGVSIPYLADNPNDGGILRVRGSTESDCILELGTWDDSGSGETIQFNYYPTTSQITPTYSVSVPKATGTIALTSQLPDISGKVNTSAVQNATSVHNLPGYNSTNIASTQYLAYWNGAYNSSGSSNLARCNRGAFGTIVTKGVANATNYSSSAATRGSRILAYDDSAGSITTSGLRTKWVTWGTSIDIDVNTNATALGLVLVATGTSTEIIRIYCAGTPSSWNVHMISGTSDLCNWSGSKQSNPDRTRLHIQMKSGSATFSAVYMVSDTNHY